MPCVCKDVANQCNKPMPYIPSLPPKKNCNTYGKMVLLIATKRNLGYPGESCDTNGLGRELLPLPCTQYNITDL